MTDPDSPGWSVIRGAAQGDLASRQEFAHLYEPVIRAYLGARWGRTPLSDQIDDAMQDCFAKLFQDGDGPPREDSPRPGGIRAFFYGVVRNIARRLEGKPEGDREARPETAPEVEGLPEEDEPLSRVFDRAWALAVVNQAVDGHAERARVEGGAALRRLELLRLRFGENRSIEEIASRWNEDPVRVAADYALGRSEFRNALREKLRTLHPDSEVEAECDHLLALLE
jgi:DNA-directed RNA polymerase specialized sigma24 family protein